MGIFPSGDFPNVEFPKRQLPNSVPTAALGPQHVLVSALGPLALSIRSARPPLQPAAPQRALPNHWKVATWEIDYLASCHLGKCLWESTF